MITIENVGNKLFLFGRENENSTKEIITDFRPYFYVEDKIGNFKSIDGVDIKKITLEEPNQVNVERQKYSKTYEADIRYVNRYIIDTYDKLEKEKIRICYLDIEIERTENGYESCDKAVNPILMIGCWDNFENKRTEFCLNKTHTTEKELIKDFMRYIKEKDFDMLVAWNGDGFDFPFLINRMKRLKLNPNYLSRENGRSDVRKITYGVYNTHIFGRICFDLMRAYKTMDSSGKESWSLDYISKYEGVGEKDKYKGELDDLYKNDIDKFIEYNRKDVDLLKLLDEKLHIVDFFDEVRRLCLCRFEDVFMNTKMADCLCLKYAKNHNYVLPSCVDRGNEKRITGGYVKDSIPKLHNNIAVMDMKSLYPSIMIGFNTSYETLLDKKEPNCINMFDEYYYKKEQGIIPAIVKPMLELRKKVNKQKEQAKEKYGKNSIEYQTLYMNQFALKVIANSFYGVMLEPHFRLGKRDVGQSITFAAQLVTKEVHRWFESKGMEVIYGDTDSCFVTMGDRTKEEMIKLNKEINQYFKEYFKKFDIDDDRNIFKLEFEKICKTVLFKIKANGKGAKKRYAARVIWDDGEDCDKLYIVGFESKRSDNSEVGRTFMKEVLRKIVYEEKQEDIISYINEFKNKIKTEFTPEQIAIPMGISKALEDYGNQIHVAASRKANAKFNANIKRGDKVKYIYVKGADRVIAFKSSGYMWDGYQIDYNKMIRRLVDMKVAPLFDSLGWKHNFDIKVGKIKKEKYIPLSKSMTQKELW
jgi:DNA polymerase I